MSALLHYADLRPEQQQVHIVCLCRSSIRQALQLNNAPEPSINKGQLHESSAKGVKMACSTLTHCAAVKPCIQASLLVLALQADVTIKVVICARNIKPVCHSCMWG